MLQNKQEKDIRFCAFHRQIRIEQAYQRDERHMIRMSGDTDHVLKLCCGGGLGLAPHGVWPRGGVKPGEEGGGVLAWSGGWGSTMMMYRLSQAVPAYYYKPRSA